VYHFLVCSMIAVLGLILTQCGTYEYRKRPDASEVAVIRDIQNVFPEFASEVTGVLEGFKIQSGLIEGSLGRGEMKNQIVRLYEQKDQLNAQLRDFVVARYQSYINAELDPDKAARERGRKDWNDVTARIHGVALDLRKLKESIDKADREHAEAKEKSKETQKKKVDSKIKISKTGTQIEDEVAGFVKKIEEPNVERIAHQVRSAKGQLEDALRTDEVPKARAAADKIRVGVSQIWDPMHTGQPRGTKALELSKQLQKSVDDYDMFMMELKEQKLRADLAENEYAAKLEEVIDSLKVIGAQLTAAEGTMSH